MISLLLALSIKLLNTKSAIPIRNAFRFVPDTILLNDLTMILLENVRWIALEYSKKLPIWLNILFYFTQITDLPGFNLHFFCEPNRKKFFHVNLECLSVKLHHKLSVWSDFRRYELNERFKPTKTPNRIVQRIITEHCSNECNYYKWRRQPRIYTLICFTCFIYLMFMKFIWIYEFKIERNAWVYA